MTKCILLILAALPFLGNAHPEEPEYIVIEKDYAGTVLLDVETGARYLETGEEIYILEDMRNEKIVIGAGEDAGEM